MVTSTAVPGPGVAARAVGGTATRRAVVMGGATAAGAAALAACGAPGGGETSGAGVGAGSSKAFRLLWQIRGGAPYEELVKWGTGEYKKKYPNATVDTTLDAGNVEKTTALMVAGEGPDVYHGWGHNLWQYAAKGQMYNHNDLIRDYKKADIDDFADFQWKGFIIPGTNFRFGMPTYINMMVIYYNKSIFAKRGQAEPNVNWNLDDYANALRKLTHDDAGKKVWGGFMPTGYDRFQNKVLNFGGHIVDPKDLTKTQLDQAPAQQGMQWIHDRLWKDQTFAPIATSRRTWEPTSQNDGFFQGVIGMLEDGMHTFQTICERMTGEWNIAHVPKGPARRAVLGTTDGWALWKGTKNKDAAWDLMKFLGTTEWFAQQAKIAGIIPSRKSALQSYITAMKDKWPAAQKIDFKVITDALTVMNYPTVDEIFLCQADVATKVINPALTAVFANNEKPVTHFRDIKSDIEREAAICGLKPQEVFR